MEQRRKGKRPSGEREANPYHVYYENYLDTNACTECTGLMPKAVPDREQWDAYRDVFDFTVAPAPDDRE